MYGFMIKGLEETEQNLRGKNIPFHLLEGFPQATVPDFVSTPTTSPHFFLFFFWRGFSFAFKYTRDRGDIKALAIAIDVDPNDVFRPFDILLLSSQTKGCCTRRGCCSYRHEPVKDADGLGARYVHSTQGHSAPAHPAPHAPQAHPSRTQFR